MTKTTRCTLLTGALAAAATVPAVALATTPDDPTFNLIKKHRQDWDAFSAANLVDRPALVKSRSSTACPCGGRKSPSRPGEELLAAPPARAL